MLSLMKICDLNIENPAYVGANSVILDQHFHLIHILFVKYAEREKRGFTRCSYVKKRARRLKGAHLGIKSK